MYVKNKWTVAASHKQMQADPTVREIAQELGISRSYVSRIEKRALQKLSEGFSEEDRDF